MRIGLNLLYLLPGVVGGTETYAAGLLYGLAQIDTQNKYVVFVNRETAEWSLPEASNFTRIVCPVCAVSRGKRFFFEQVYLPKLLKAHGVNLVHSLGYVAPLFPPCPSVVTVHDMNFRQFGGRMPFIRMIALEFFVKQSTRRADYIIAVSEFTRAQISAELLILMNRIAVIPEAPFDALSIPLELVEILWKYGIKQPYIIAFSSFSPHKNISRLYQAFVQACRDYTLPHQLVIVGHRPSDESDHGGVGVKDVVCTGYVEEAVKKMLLVGAEMLVFPSTYEGFGLPVLEAQQAGVPVICSMAASLPEVAGDAAIYFDPLSVDEIKKTIGQVARNPALRNTLKQKGFLNVERFSWEQTARLTLLIYQKVVKARLLPQAVQPEGSSAEKKREGEGA
jgi:glycosyltransferase involved in cell wall biosynthesis